MKKTYISPVLTVQNIELQSLMAGSFKFDDENGTGTGSLSDEYATGGGMSRGSRSIWDDEE